MITEAKNKAASLKSLIETRKAVKENLILQKKELEKQLENVLHDINLNKQAISLLSLVGAKAQESAKAHFEGAATVVLKSIFGDDFQFQMDISVGGQGQPSLNFSIASKYGEGETLIVDPVSGSGGGVRDIIGLALRIAFLGMVKNKSVVFLDEPMAQLSSEYQEPMGKLLRVLQNRLNYQILMITHEDNYIEHADSVIQVKLVNSISQVQMMQ